LKETIENGEKTRGGWRHESGGEEKGDKSRVAKREENTYIRTPLYI